MKIGITGQSGFVGTHLYNTIGLMPEKFQRIPFQDIFFQQKTTLQSFVKKCDVIVHLAAMNRHNDPEIIFNTNIKLVNQLIEACEISQSTPHIIFSSSTQEELDNIYGRSKKEGRELLLQWAKKYKARFTGLIIPNVFGPFGLPYYNSVVATFCHQLTHNEKPKIEIDSNLKLIYVGELVHSIIQSILRTEGHPTTVQIPCTSEINVSELLDKLENFKTNYYENGIIPDLSNSFELNLFNSFLCYIDHQKIFPAKLKLNTDHRGSFVETIKLNSGGQISFSTTIPGITRGNHYHTRKVERFAVIQGKARIEIRKIGTKNAISYELDGKQPAYVDMPIWYTHNITNIGNEELCTIFWINESYDPHDPDTYFEQV